MPQKALTDGQCREAVAAFEAAGLNLTRAAALVNLTRGAMQNRVAEAKRRGIVPAVKPAPGPSRLPISADECWALLDSWIGRKRIPAVKPPKWQAKARQRIVIASDFHAPFHCPEAVAELITREAATTDTLVVNGDLMDFYSISRFVKYEHVPIEQELAATDALLAQLAGAFKDVLIVSGNHDAPRFEKQLRGILTPEMMHVIEFLTGGNLSVIHALAKRYSNVRFSPIHVDRFKVTWAAQVGDLICAHAEKYSKVPGSALRGIDEWFTDQDHALGLQPWRVLVQAHTHQLGAFPWKADRLLVEGGAMCQLHGYQLTARIAGRPQRRGYVTLEQRDGVTDLNSVRFVWLDPVLR